MLGRCQVGYTHCLSERRHTGVWGSPDVKSGHLVLRGRRELVDGDQENGVL
jgi:hypothetical protein